MEREITDSNAWSPLAQAVHPGDGVHNHQSLEPPALSQPSPQPPCLDSPNDLPFSTGA